MFAIILFISLIGIGAVIWLLVSEKKNAGSNDIVTSASEVKTFEPEKINMVDSHQRNKNICKWVMILLIVLQFAFGILVGMSGRYKDKTQIAHVTLGVNMIWGIFFLILFGWYIHTAEFKQKWFLFLILILVYFLNIYLGMWAWIVFFFVITQIINRRFLSQ